MDFRIETSGREPIYRQLVRQIREAIAVGALDAEEKVSLQCAELSRQLGRQSQHHRVASMPSSNAMGSSAPGPASACS